MLGARLMRIVRTMAATVATTIAALQMKRGGEDSAAVFVEIRVSR
jgi:hypothetical protein